MSHEKLTRVRLADACFLMACSGAGRFGKVGLARQECLPDIIPGMIGADVE